MAEIVTRIGDREPQEPNGALRSILAPIDRVALGTAVGALSGLALFAATIVLVIRGGAVVGPHLSLLSHYIPGYSVTWIGSGVGAVGGFAWGVALGFGVATVRNAIARAYAQVSLLLARFDQYLDSM